MDTKCLTEKVVAPGVLIQKMTELPTGGATEIELEATEKRIGVALNLNLIAYAGTCGTLQGMRASGYLVGVTMPAILLVIDVDHLDRTAEDTKRESKRTGAI